MLPQQIGETLFLFDLHPDARALDRADDLGAVADNARIVHQFLHLGGIVIDNEVRLETVKGLSEGLAFAQDGDP